MCLHNVSKCSCSLRHKVVGGGSRNINCMMLHALENNDITTHAIFVIIFS